VLLLVAAARVRVVHGRGPAGGPPPAKARGRRVIRCVRARGGHQRGARVRVEAGLRGARPHAGVGAGQFRGGTGTAGRVGTAPHRRLVRDPGTLRARGGAAAAAQRRGRAGGARGRSRRRPRGHGLHTRQRRGAHGRRAHFALGGGEELVGDRHVHGLVRRGRPRRDPHARSPAGPAPLACRGGACARRRRGAAPPTGRPTRQRAER